MAKQSTKVSREISFVFNGKKSINVILYIIEQCGGKINQYNLLKIIFEADKYHLNNHRRPVTGDTYRNMSFGTVPDAIYNTIKGNRSPKKYLKELEMTALPFKYNKKTHMLTSSVSHDPKRFTKTNIEALKQGIKKYGGLNFEEVKQTNHEEKCWRETERNEIIPFELIVEDKTTLELLSEHPYGIVVL